jgi:D-lactate dehydrogenase
MGSKRIAFFDAKPYDILSFDEVNKNYGFEIKYFENHISSDNALLAKDHDAVCVFVNDLVNKDIIDIFLQGKVKLLALRCAGYNNVDLQAIYDKIHAVRVPAYSPYAVAEHAAALMLALNRKIHRAYYRTRDGNFSINGLLGFDMYAKTIGIIGAGKIGRVMVDIALGFGMKVLVYDSFKDEAYAATKGIKYASLDEIYGASDIITLHCPLTPSTQHMINAEAIDKMKPGVMIINTGRGKLIDTRALIDGLKSSHIGSAGLDVYEEESEYFFEDFSNAMVGDDILARLLTFPNVLITSHQAFFTKEALHNIADTTLSSIKEYFDGGFLKNEICYKCNNDCLKKQGKRCF